jgi:peptidoglycan/xylan/chitin deacetylase (PgdA/CDA1 family)
VWTRVALAGGAATVVVVVVAVVTLTGGGSDRSVAPSVTTTTISTVASAPHYPVAVPVTIPPGPVAPVLSKIPTTNPVVFFTIDDGLVRDPAAVDFIRVHHIPVTLFILPVPLQQDPAYFLTLAQVGASVQDHTVHHLLLPKLSAARQVAEVCGSVDLLHRTFGRRPWLFRPPYGEFNTSTKYAVRQCGLQAIVTWQGTMNDGVLRLQHPGPLQPGDIILMHFRPDLRRNLEVLLKAAKDAGLIAAPLEQYLTEPTP